MTLIDEHTRTQVKEVLGGITRTTELKVYTAGPLVLPGQNQPGMQQETLRLFREVATLNTHITVTEASLNDADAQALGLTHAPATPLRERSNIRSLDLPSGYEFSTLIETLLMLGTGNSGLNERAKRDLAVVTTPVRMQAFVTPTCPSSPQAVLTAYRFTYENPDILAEGVEATNFPSLVSRYGVQSNNVFVQSVPNAAGNAA